jgi:hypothetical protein
MKTILQPTESKLKSLNEEIEKSLAKKGFKLTNVESACARHVAVSEKAYTKLLGFAFSDRPVTVYVYNEGIGVDIDYKQGRNYINSYRSFAKSENFDEAYRKMINFANDYLDVRIPNNLVK